CVSPSSGPRTRSVPEGVIPGIAHRSVGQQDRGGGRSGRPRATPTSWTTTKATGTVARTHSLGEQDSPIHLAVHPPSTARVSPVTKEESPNARKATASAISSGRPHRPS